MKRLAAILIIISIVPLAGCKPVGKALSSLQFHNIDWRLSKTIMTITVGDGKLDMKQAMKKETFAGSVCQGRVTVDFPEGLQTTACQLAQDFDGFYPIVKQRLGIEWDFDLELKLVRVPSTACGFRYSTKITKNRRLTFPIPIIDECPCGRWTPTVAHEMTEASLIAPKSRKQLVLADLWAGSCYISTGARWFRDGASDYASYLFADQLPSGSLYRELNEVRDRLLGWANYDGAPNWYDAAAALIFEMKNRFGEDAVNRLMCELAKEPAPGGGGLKRAFKRVTGVDLEQFLKTYETPWTGVVVCEDRCDVVVAAIYPASPASRRGIKADDIIVSLADCPVHSVDEFNQLLARQQVWQIVPIEIRRDGQLLPMRLKLIPRPVDIDEFLRLSGIQKGPH